MQICLQGVGVLGKWFIYNQNDITTIFYTFWELVYRSNRSTDFLMVQTTWTHAVVCLFRFSLILLPFRGLNPPSKTIEHYVRLKNEAYIFAYFLSNNSVKIINVRSCVMYVKVRPRTSQTCERFKTYTHTVQILQCHCVLIIQSLMRVSYTDPLLCNCHLIFSYGRCDLPVPCDVSWRRLSQPSSAKIPTPA